MIDRMRMCSLLSYSPLEVSTGNCSAYLHHKLFSYVPLTSSWSTLMYPVVLQGHFDVTLNWICTLWPSNVQTRRLPLH